MFLHVSEILFMGEVYHTLPAQIPPWADIPPAQCMLGYPPPLLGYGQQADGTLRTGMHSCN